MRHFTVLAAAALLLSGCGIDVEPAPSPAELAVQGAHFGGVTLPPDAQVLAVRHDDRGPDEAYRLTLKTNPAGAKQLVTESGLDVEPQQQTQIFSEDVLAGPALVEGPGVVSWKNRTSIDGHSVVRDVTIDDRAAPDVYVHMILFGT